MLHRWSRLRLLSLLTLALLSLLESSHVCWATPELAPGLDASAELAGVDLDGFWPAPQQGLPMPPLGRTLLWIALAALAYGLLVAAKARAVQHAAALRKARVLPLVRASGGLRAAAAAALLFAACCAVLWLDSSLLAALALAFALALAAHRPPLSEAALRGPGQWQPLDSSALAPLRSVPLPGAWLDVGRPRGCALLLAALAANSWLAFRLFESSPYHAACLLLGSSALLPVFFTGRAAELPEPELAESRLFLGRVLRALSGTPELAMQPLGRLCTGATELDELRLALHPGQSLPGLIGVELGLELRPVLTGQSAWPVLVIRVADGSACQRALPRQLTWTRGRSAEERAALLRPKLPSVALAVDLIRELLQLTSLSNAASPSSAREGRPLRKTSPKPRNGPRTAPLGVS